MLGCVRAQSGEFHALRKFPQSNTISDDQLSFKVNLRHVPLDVSATAAYTVYIHAVEYYKMTKVRGKCCR